jgi:transposase-like protein
MEKKIVDMNERLIKEHYGTIVKDTVEQTLNSMLEADQLSNTDRYDHTEVHKDTRAGYYKRSLHIKTSEVSLYIPKLRKLPFETAIIERYCRRESSVEEA